MAEPAAGRTAITRILEALVQSRNREPLWREMLSQLVLETGASGGEIHALYPAAMLASSEAVAEPPASTSVYPLIASGKIYGALTLYFLTPEGLAEENSPVVRLFAAVAAPLLQGAALHEEVSRFVHGATHDLRGNLVRANNFGEMVARNLSSADDRTLWETVTQNLLEAEVLLKGLSSYAEAGLRSDPPADVSLRDAAGTAFWNLKKAIDAAGAKVAWEGDDVVVHAPERELVEVIGRLVDNSLKFAGPAPKVRVSAHMDNGMATIAVHDNGPGIEARYAGMLFTPFQRLHGKQHPGHGLGLAICRKIVEGLGGTIGIDPETPAGARVVIRLPQ